MTSYGKVAAQIDKPKAIRTVETACGKNRIGILLPQSSNIEK